jgi:DNA-directed RNA polymerase subunit RPC12/RpoP
MPEAIDHAAEAAALLARRPIYGSPAESNVRRATVHVGLALVERLDRLLAGDVGKFPTRIVVPADPPRTDDEEAFCLCPHCGAEASAEALNREQGRCPRCGVKVVAMKAG